MNINTIDLRFLGRAQVKIAVEAFREALDRSAEFEGKVPSSHIREVIASSIIDQVLAGEEDKLRLKEEALVQLRQGVRMYPSTRVSLEAPRKSLG
ncbi:MAG: hypothetical protein LAT81_12220 [Oceanicaulis sp.]|nr:hypothetical protein [Oceanicaulis sp.]